MNLQLLIQDNWEKSKFISISLNPSIRGLIETETSFLNSYYSNIPLRTRAYVILHSFNESTLPKCKCGCGKPCAINKTYSEQGFREYANSTCSRKSKTISSDSKSKLENYEWIYEQRITLKKSIEQIAEELNISTIPIVKYLKQHNLDKLIDARRRNSITATILSDKEQLQSLYIKGLTCEEIANQLSTTKSTVSRWLKIHQIQTRDSNSYERKVKRISKEENTLYEYILSIYNGEVKQSNRSILKGKELDIYIPDKKIAIEYNGLYSHYYRPDERNESLIKGSSYHLNKTIECKKQGIQLLQFYSDEWNYKQDIVKSIISSKLRLNKSVYARQCNKIIVDVNIKNKFLNDNHIQGEDKSRIKLGLEYNGELICLMTFCKSRFNRNYEWELSRFCTKKGYNVVGGFSRLLKWFKDSYTGSIVSYADRRYSQGDVYLKNGFNVIKVNKPSYYYVDNNCLKRFNRMKFQKKLIGAYDCTEYEKARELGYNKIYDCGTICFGMQ